MPLYSDISNRIYDISSPLSDGCYVGQCALSSIQWFHLFSAFRKFMLTAFGRSRVCVSFRWALPFLGLQTITNQAMYFWRRWNDNVWSSLSYSLLSVFIMFWLFIDNNRPVFQYFSSNGISFPLSICQCQNGLSAGIIRFVLFVHIPFHSSISNSLQLHNSFPPSHIPLQISNFISPYPLAVFILHSSTHFKHLKTSLQYFSPTIKMWCFFSVFYFFRLLKLNKLCFITYDATRKTKKNFKKKKTPQK